MPWRRSMSSCGRLSDVMMMMMMNVQILNVLYLSIYVKLTSDNMG